jgi:hypothetical protein
MKVSRIWRAFPWRLAGILALIPGLSLLAFWAWYTWQLPPLQRYYLVAYWDSTVTLPSECVSLSGPGFED